MHNRDAYSRSINHVLEKAKITKDLTKHAIAFAGNDHLPAFLLFVLENLAVSPVAPILITASASIIFQ